MAGLVTFAKLALQSGISFTHEFNEKTKRSRIIVPLDTEIVWGDGFASVTEHHETLMAAKALSGVEIANHKHHEMSFKNPPILDEISFPNKEGRK